MSAAVRPGDGAGAPRGPAADAVLDGVSNAAPGGAGSTPLMQQYQEIKARHPGAILFFRMGDFYDLK